MRIPGAGTAVRLGRVLARSRLISNHQRQIVLRHVEKGRFREAWISAEVSMARADEVSMGPGCFLNEGVFLDRQVHLGRNVYIGPRAMIITAAHAVGGSELRAALGGPQPVSVGDGTWIGAGAILLPGITVGEGCVIGAGAVVTRSCAPNGLYAGVPAQRLKDLPIDSEVAS